MAESQTPEEDPIDITKEFGGMIAKREAEKKALAQSFIEGGMWLAQQKDPFRQLYRIANMGYMKTMAEKQEANQQFGELIRDGKTDVGRFFGLMAGIYVFDIDPQKFFRTIEEYEQKLRLQNMNSVTKINKDFKFDLEKLMKNDEAKTDKTGDDSEKNKIKPFGLRRPSNFIIDPSGSMQEPKKLNPFEDEEFRKKIDEIIKKLPKYNKGESDEKSDDQTEV